MLSRKDWISQVTNISNASANFKKSLKLVCPVFNIRQVIYGQKMKIQILITLTEYYFGQILNVIDETYNVQIINGTSILSVVNDFEEIPEDLQDVYNLFQKHPIFGIIVKESTRNINIRKNNIVSHCCKFSDNSYEYIFSLNFRCAGK